MEINALIKELIDSGIIENQELGVTLLGTDQISEEEKRAHVDKFVKDYMENKIDFTDEDHKHIFKAWVEIYRASIKMDIQNRVRRIE